MNIYIAISDFTEEILLKHLQNPHNSVVDLKQNFQSEPCLLEKDSIENKPRCISVSETTKKDHIDSLVEDITKSVDSGVFLEPKDDESSCSRYTRNRVLYRSASTRRDKSVSDETKLSREKFLGKGYQTECFSSLNIRQEQKKPLVIYFHKGDIFAGLTPEDRCWRGVYSLRSGEVGFVPVGFFEKIEDRQNFLTKDGLISSRDVHMRALSQLQASSALRVKPDIVKRSKRSAMDVIG